MCWRNCRSKIILIFSTFSRKKPPFLLYFLGLADASQSCSATFVWCCLVSWLLFRQTSMFTWLWSSSVDSQGLLWSTRLWWVSSSFGYKQCNNCRLFFIFFHSSSVQTTFTWYRERSTTVKHIHRSYAVMGDCVYLHLSHRGGVVWSLKICFMYNCDYNYWSRWTGIVALHCLFGRQLEAPATGALLPSHPHFGIPLLVGSHQSHNTAYWVFLESF